MAEDGGAAAVEFALISAVLFPVLFGILQYGFFFFQLSSTERALAAAARQVEVGGVPTCEVWESQAVASLPGAKTATASWVRQDGTDEPLLRGDRVVVSIEWDPVRLGGGLVPFPGVGRRISSTETTLDHPGDPSIWGGTIVGCPL